jgi:hypothetical protein
VRSRTTAQFRKAFSELPTHVQDRARRAYRRFLTDPNDLSLQFKRVHTKDPIYSARVSLGYRALAVLDGDDLIWFWIGSHADYDKLLTRR